MKTEIILAILIIVLLQGCTKTDLPSSNTSDLLNGGNTFSSVEKIEVYHFHGTSQCYSCKTVGAYAEETVNLYYSDEVRAGKIVFQSINYDLPENKELAAKYGVGGSSLWIGVYDHEGFHPEQNTDVWLKINNKEEILTLP